MATPSPSPQTSKLMSAVSHGPGGTDLCPSPSSAGRCRALLQTSGPVFRPPLLGVPASVGPPLEGPYCSEAPVVLNAKPTAGDGVANHSALGFRVPAHTHRCFVSCLAHVSLAPQRRSSLEVSCHARSVFADLSVSSAGLAPISEMVRRPSGQTGAGQSSP